MIWRNVLFFKHYLYLYIWKQAKCSLSLNTSLSYGFDSVSPQTAHKGFLSLFTSTLWNYSFSAHSTSIPSLICSPSNQVLVFFFSVTVQPVSLSRSLLLPLLHYLSVLWCCNRWINDCFYFHSECLLDTNCFVLQNNRTKNFGDGKKNKVARRSNMFLGGSCCEWHYELSLNSWIYLHLQVMNCALGNISELSVSFSSCHPHHKLIHPWIWQLHFVSSLCMLALYCNYFIFA